MKTNISISGACLLFILLSSISARLNAQTARSLYFIDNAPTRLNLNPALQPMRGYFNFPVIGAFGTSIVSDPLSVDDFIDIIDQKNDFLQNDELFNKLKNKNEINFDLTTDILSFGFYAGKGFWTVNVGTKVMLSTSIPKSLFEFARNSDKLEEYIDHYQDLTQLPAELDYLLQGYQVKDLRINVDAFAEIGIGYSRPVNEKLTLGGRAKVLIGIANLDAHVNEMSITPNINNLSWDVTTRGKMDVSMKGLELTSDANENYINDMDIDSPGIGGFGAGIDLGATYKILKQLTVSAAVIDLGFINWSKSSTTYASVNESHSYKASEEGTDIFDYDLIQFQTTDETKGRTTAMRPTLNIGAEYTFFNNQLGIGVLSSTRFQKPETFSELTISANYHPRNWFAATLSYSILHSDFKTLGLGLKLGPVFLASDYIPTGDLKSIKRANAYLGISIPMGKKKSAVEYNY